jgi:multidrug efflux pump subunit AcrA (membrane-fusion protein)
MTDPSAAGSIAQAPVQVNITTQSVHNVLAIPIDALITEPSGYDVEVAGADGSRRLVPVTLGLFDDTAGLVQVTGSLKAGQQVVVPQL